MKKILVFTAMVILFLCFNLFAEDNFYTGKAENIKTNDRGIAFTVVVENSLNEEVLRKDQWVSTGVMTGAQAVSAVKNVVDRMTQEIYAHIEGAKEAIKEKVELEKYRSRCNKFIESKNRPSPQTERIE